MEYKRLIEPYVAEDLKKKMVLLAGPRQSGKTSLSKKLLTDSRRYLNWDFGEDRELIYKETWPAGPGLIVLDEIHKYDNWRNAVKGLFDKRRDEVQILVTGSARLEYYSHGGDSLQGRYFLHHLFPLTVAELDIETRADFDALLTLSGFPEPFFGGSKTERDRWARSYRELLVREDLRDLERVTSINKIEQLAIRLPALVASPLSLNSLREDLDVSHAAITDWCNILERLYYIFRLRPLGGPSIKTIKKQSKHYQYDWSLVTEPGPRLENLVALHLLKWVTFQCDTTGKEIELCYYRDVEKREVDFVIVENNKPVRAIECKISAKGADASICYFKSQYPEVECIQVELECQRPLETSQGIKIVPLIEFLREVGV